MWVFFAKWFNIKYSWRDRIWISMDDIFLLAHFSPNSFIRPKYFGTYYICYVTYLVILQSGRQCLQLANRFVASFITPSKQYFPHPSQTSDRPDFLKCGKSQGTHPHFLVAIAIWHSNMQPFWEYWLNNFISWFSFLNLQSLLVGDIFAAENENRYAWGSIVLKE